MQIAKEFLFLIYKYSISFRILRVCGKKYSTGFKSE